MKTRVRRKRSSRFERLGREQIQIELKGEFLLRGNYIRGRGVWVLEKEGIKSNGVRIFIRGEVKQLKYDGSGITIIYSSSSSFSSCCYASRYVSNSNINEGR